MNVQRLHFPAAALLCALTLSAWTYFINGTRSGLSVVNHGGSVLRNVEVCLTSGECAVRARLWPHEAWQVPVQEQPGAVVQVRYQETRDQKGGVAVREPQRQQAEVVVQRDGQIRLAR